MADTAGREIARCRGVLAQVKEQERKLLHIHYQERISGELFDEEQTRLRRERLDAEALIGRLDVRHEDIAATLSLRSTSSAGTCRTSTPGPTMRHGGS